MARRRKSSRRRRGGRFGFLFKLLCMLAVCAAILAAMTLFFRVHKLVVTGQQRYTQEQILEASGVRTGANLFLLNKYDAANSILHKLPYIQEVRINRKLPDTLLIDVTECGGTLALVQDGAAWLISPGGKIVDRQDPAEAAKDPVLDGCTLLAPSVGSALALDTDHAAQQKSLLALLAALEKSGMLDQVDAIHLDSATEVVMDYAGRFSVEMPYGADYVYKLRNLQAVIDKLETNETGTVDLRKDGEAHVLPSR
jgi:cell division protein FtsQ